MNIDLMDNHINTFKTNKPFIGCVHLMALPGTPHYDKSVSFKEQVERAIREAKALQNAGFDALIFANEGDRPYLFNVGPEIIASYVRIATEVLQHVEIPYGCGVLIDPIATIAIAKALDAKFVRTYVTGTYADIFGFHEFRPGDIYRFRKNIDAEDVNLYCYFDAHGGTSLDTRSQSDMIDTAFSTLNPAGVLIPGQRAGLAPDFNEVREIKNRYKDKPIMIASGVNSSNVREARDIADGFVIGTCLKKDGILWNEIDEERAKKFIEIAKGN
ncbi:BtpA/SgcQ family protein [Desnuesiella massiliensis]|uniref:BtpA/SgcQ family protein n=1 Tax=Desnuesiella massiliensis TaxID=1650662 RepID=UPI0006E29B86|nr:BtpA/SgcQ family protein [Desnuesiella massiliensis]